MKPLPSDSHDRKVFDVELARGFTIRNYHAARDSSPPKQAEIASALRRRFTDRYLDPVFAKPNGFTMMAVACLMIETLESFYRGWPTTVGKSGRAFEQFFERVDAFREFRHHHADFYKHIRCGILHQAEATGGWRVRRDGPLFDSSVLTINAKRFVEALREELEAYCTSIERLPPTSDEWKCAIKKLNAIVKNCRTAG